MNQQKSAIVIGAGIGGIATALFLAQAGYSVRVFERNATLGGRCGKINRDGHRFDLGATIYLMPSIYADVFRSMGVNPEDLFKWVPLPVLYNICFEKGDCFRFSPDEKILETECERIEPGSFHRARQLRISGYRMFQLAMDRLIGRNYITLREFITPGNMLMLYKLKAYMRHMAYVGRYFKSPRLRTAFTFQNIYVGQDPFRAPALFAMIPAAELTEGSLAPVGGMSSIASGLVSLAEKYGVVFHPGTPVARILVSHNRATAVVLENGQIAEAQIIVANADLPYVYKQLLPPSLMNPKLRMLRYTCSSIVIHWGLDKRYPQLSHHNVFISEDYRRNLKAIFKSNSLADRPSFYVHAPVALDPSAAPEGHDSLSVLVPSGHLRKGNTRDWEALKSTAREWVIERLKAEGLHDIEEHIKFEICFTPKNWQDSLNLTRGSTFGSLGHQVLQMGYFRPHNRHRKYKNLYFAGGSTHPGNGIPLVLLSARLTSERILKET